MADLLSMANGEIADILPLAGSGDKRQSTGRRLIVLQPQACRQYQSWQFFT
jgi:hypothetical protein